MRGEVGQRLRVRGAMPRRESGRVDEALERFPVQGRDGRGGRARPIVDPQEANPELRSHALEGPGKWGHDMYVQIEGSRAGQDLRTASPLGTKL